jgi:2-amino-4-hydroxy-6-hydroxymethyldihydropteridine diphosphokinase
MQASHVYETSPVGVENQPAFLNQAVEIETDLEPLELLVTVKSIERELGRTETTRWGPRVIDIDIILWGGRTVKTPNLTIPHKQFRRRAFVLKPLQEIAPNAIDPESGMRVAQLAGRPEAEGDANQLKTVH